MPSPDPRAPVAAIRHAISAAVASTSLRAVARDVGMSPTGLREFLNGREPYSATLRKLVRWYLLREGNRGGHPDDLVRAGMAVLLEAVSEEARGEAAAMLLDALARIHRDLKAPPPAWLERLQGRPAPPPEG